MEILSLSFFNHALLASIFVSIACGLIGVFVIANRLVFLSGGIAHGAYGGVGIAFFLGLSPLVGGGVFAVFLAFLIGFISLQNRQNTDSVIGAIWALGMAAGIIFTDITPGYNVDLMSYLFGGILAVSKTDLYTMALVASLIAVSITLFYRQLQAMSFDTEFASLIGVRVKFLYFLLLCLVALCIVVSVRAVGLILVIALLTMPPFIAQLFSKNLLQMLIISSSLSLFFCISGLFLSFAFSLSSGACIILVCSCGFFISIIIHKILKI